MKYLNDITKKKFPEITSWSEDIESAFEILKLLLYEAHTGKTQNPEKPYNIQRDACSYQEAVCLSQRVEKENLYPINLTKQKFIFGVLATVILIAEVLKFILEREINNKLPFFGIFIQRKNNINSQLISD